MGYGFNERARLDQGRGRRHARLGLFDKSVGDDVGYDFHITRANSWFDSEQYPITLEEWESFARGNQSLELELDSSITFTNFGTLNIYALKCDPSRDVTLSWYDFRIEVTGIQDIEAIRACVILAEALQANFLGDEGEKYLPDGTGISEE
ncbi:hypothetical protein [Actinomadura spongiicola]|uniref:hypothetical protein n=1 Tax=Actinomadura spongiicola TaxID=2303421 RepID=UPI0011C10726|nr:hypothetical protein [Actinomadura spongiicola]